MNVTVTVASAALVVALASSCQSSRSSEQSVSDPAGIVSVFLHAFNHLDIEELRGLFAEDATAFLPVGPAGARLDGRDAIIKAIEPLFASERARSSHGPPYLSLQAKDVKVQRLGDMAVISFDVGSQLVFSRRTLVLQNVDRRWLIVHLHGSNLRAAQ